MWRLSNLLSMRKQDSSNQPCTTSIMLDKAKLPLPIPLENTISQKSAKFLRELKNSKKLLVKKQSCLWRIILKKKNRMKDSQQNNLYIFFHSIQDIHLKYLTLGSSTAGQRSKDITVLCHFLQKYFLIYFIIIFCVSQMLVLLMLAVASAVNFDLVSPNFHTVAIIGTNDIHGSAFPTSLFRSDTNQSYNYGGLEYMAQMIRTIKEQYKGNVLYLDGGDQFQGGIESSKLVSSGQIMNDFYNVIGVAGSAIGNHEFDFGPSFLFPYLGGKNSDSSNLAANLRSQTGQENFLPLQKGEAIYKMKSGIKIGVIGLSTIETLSSTAAFNDGTFPPYQFLDYAPIVLERSQKLRRAGANAVLVVGHVGNDCNADSKYGIWDQYTEQNGQCSPTDEISLLIKALPTGTIDGIIQGHRHQFSHHFIQGVPVIGAINGGYYFNILYLKFYNRKIYHRVIEGPIPVCDRVFSNLRTCGYLKSSQLPSAGALVPWEFHGVTVKKHAQLEKIYTTKWLPLMAQYLVPLVNNEVLMPRIYKYENDLGNLITNLMNAAVPGCDAVLLNAGGFRSTWIPGVIQYQHFYNMFPFANTINSFEMTGQELLDTLNVIQSGANGFYPTYGLSQVVSLSSSGIKKFISAKFYNGTQIIPTKNYRIISLVFLTQGGDDFKDVIGKVYTVRNEILHGDFRALIQPKLMELGIIRQNTLVDPLHPRLQVNAV